MKMGGASPRQDGDAIILTYKEVSLVVQVEGTIGNVTVGGGQFYLLDPGCGEEGVILRETTVKAMFPSYEQKKNQVIFI